jgi:hypothetical protein
VRSKRCQRAPCQQSSFSTAAADVDLHVPVLIHIASIGKQVEVIHAQIKNLCLRHIWTVSDERSSCPSSARAIKINHSSLQTLDSFTAPLWFSNPSCSPHLTRGSHRNSSPCHLQRPPQRPWTSRGGAPGLGYYLGGVTHQEEEYIASIWPFLFAVDHQNSCPLALLCLQSATAIT